MPVVHVFVKHRQINALVYFVKHRQIAHFTVAGENEVGVDLVLIRPFLLYYM